MPFGLFMNVADNVSLFGEVLYQRRIQHQQCGWP